MRSLQTLDLGIRKTNKIDKYEEYVRELEEDMESEEKDDTNGDWKSGNSYKEASDIFGRPGEKCIVLENMEQFIKTPGGREVCKGN